MPDPWRMRVLNQEEYRPGVIIARLDWVWRVSCGLQPCLPCPHRASVQRIIRQRPLHRGGSDFRYACNSRALRRTTVGNTSFHLRLPSAEKGYARLMADT